MKWSLAEVGGEYMPSQSSSDGESMPDHWMRTVSPDLERVMGETKTETLDWKEGLKKKMEKRKKSVKGIIFSDGVMRKELNFERWDWQEDDVNG